MHKQSGAVTKLNLKNIRTPYFVTGLVFLVIFVQSIVYTILALTRGITGQQLTVSSGCYFWLLVIMAAIFIPTKHYRHIINLGGKRDGFFGGGIMTYAILAGAVSLLNTILYYTFERFLIGTGYFASFDAFVQDNSMMEHYFINVNVVEVFGWSARGPFFAVIQQFAFLLLLAAVIHTLTAMQDKWYGWVTDAVIAAILGVFIPVAPLRSALLWFFNIILFHSNALVQITVCLALAAVIYALNKPIFARKAI